MATKYKTDVHGVAVYKSNDDRVYIMQHDDVILLYPGDAERLVRALHRAIDDSKQHE